MTINRALLRTLCTILTLSLAEVAVAQKAPEVGYVYPGGGRAGQTVTVQLGLYDGTDDLEAFSLNAPVSLTLTGPGSRMLVPKPPYWFGPKANNITAFKIPREFPATITIPAEMPAGPVFWQLANANGVTKTGLFIVGDGPEIVENQHRLQPQKLDALPVVINGRVMGIEEVDRYRFSLPQTSLVTCDLFTRRLNTPMHGVLKVHDDAGNLVADAVDTEGVDTNVSFVAEAGREYQISVHDLDFRGNRAYVYRLALTTGPRVLATLPAVGCRGTKADVRFLGVGLKSGTAAVESITRTVEFLADTEADSFDVKLPVFGGKTASVKILLSNHQEKMAMFDTEGFCPISAPVGVTASFEDNRDVHRFRCRGKSRQHWRIAAEAWRFGSSLDLSLSILDANGKELANNDDLPGTTDAGLDFDVPADGDYVFVVENGSLNTDQSMNHYRLSVKELEPDYQLTIPQHATITSGGKFELTVALKRLGGFAGPVKLMLSGLPEGVTGPSEIEIPSDKNESKIPLESDEQAAVHASLVTVQGEAMIGGRAVRRNATATATGEPTPRDPEINRVSAMLLAVTMKPRAKVAPVVDGVARAASRGTTFPAEVKVERLEGFTGPVTVRMSSYQQRHRQGMSAEDVVIPANEERGIFPCFLPEWLETNRTSRMRMLALAKVPDPQGNVRELLFYQDAHVTFSLEGALLKVTNVAGEMTVTAGERFEIPLKILRSVQLPETVRLELDVPESLSGSLEAEMIEVPVDQDRAVLSILSHPDPRLQGVRSFTVRGTALERGRFPAVSEATVDVFFIAADKK